MHNHAHAHAHHTHVLPITAAACLEELERIGDYEKAVVKRMKELVSENPNLNGSAGSEQHKHYTKENLKRLSNFPISEPAGTKTVDKTDVGDVTKTTEDNQIECQNTTEHENTTEHQNKTEQNDDGSDDCKWESIQAQLTLNEDNRTSPLIDALKKVEWRARDHAEIAKWCSELAVMFFKADKKMSGRVLEDEYICLIKSLPLSSILKEDLCLQFSCIDLNDSGDISLEEFLYFFLSFPPLKKELGSTFHANEPYHNILGTVATWRKVRLWVYNVVTVPDFNLTSKILFCFDLLLAVVPFLMLLIELISPTTDPEKLGLLWFMALFFATLYLVGLVTCKSKIKFLTNRLHLVELLSFLPWMIYNLFALKEARELPSSNHPFWVGSHGAIGFFLIRIMKIVKLPSILSSSSWLQEDIDIYVKTLHLALSSYKPLGLFMFGLIIFLSTLVYAFERGEYNGDFWERYDSPGDESPFANFFNCVWFTVVTGTTLGYGDFYPKSYEGKFVGMFVVVLGLVNITILINTIGECFEEIFRTYLEDKSKKIQAERAHYIKHQVKLAERKVQDLRRKQLKMSPISWTSKSFGFEGSKSGGIAEV